jgi:hypothetical protein
MDIADHNSIAHPDLVTVNLENGAIAPRQEPLDARFATAYVLNPRVQLMPDGNAVVYPITENGVDNLWVQPLGHSPGHQLTHFTSHEISDFHWSPDGKTLAIVRQHHEADAVLLREEKQ